MKDDKEKNEESKIVPAEIDNLDGQIFDVDKIIDELYDEFIDENILDVDEAKADKDVSHDEDGPKEDVITEEALSSIEQEQIEAAEESVISKDNANQENEESELSTLEEDNLYEDALSNISWDIDEEDDEQDSAKEEQKNEAESGIISKNKFKELIEDDQTDGPEIFSLNIEAPEIIKQQQEHLKEQEKLLREKERLDNTKEFIIEESVVYDPKAEAEGEPKEAAKTSGKKAAKKPAQKKKNSKKAKKESQAKPRITKKGLMIGLSVVLLVSIGGAVVTFLSAPKENSQQTKPIVSPTTDATDNDPAIDIEDSQESVVENAEEVVEQEPDDGLEPIQEEDTLAEEGEEQPLENTETVTDPITTPVVNQNKINGVIQNIVVDNVIVLQGEEVIVYSMSDEVKTVIKNFKSGDSVVFEALEDGDSWIMLNLEAYKEDANAPAQNNNNQNIDDLEALLAGDTTQEPEQVITENQEFNEAFSSDFEGELDLIREREIQEALRQSELAEKERLESQNKTPEVSKETLEYEMEAKGSGVLWFRFAWKPNDVTKEVAAIDNVRVELRSPNGTLITPENASQNGRYWVDKGIINYAIKSGAAGKWKFVVTKNKTEKLGEIGATVSPGTGFIKIDKVSVQPREGKLLAIWKVSGVKDEELAIEVFAKRGNSEFLIYSANSADAKVYLLDKAEISTQKLEKGTYDIIIKVQDIDAAVDKKTGNKIITAKSISDIYEIKNVDIY